MKKELHFNKRKIEKRKEVEKPTGKVRTASQPQFLAFLPCIAPHSSLVFITWKVEGVKRGKFSK